MNTIGILCERVRMEEKQILAALGSEGLPAVPVPPFDLPVEIAAVAGLLPDRSAIDQFALLIDRCPERAAASQLIALLDQNGVLVLGAGVASSGNRLDVAKRLASSGVSRPRSVLVSSEKAGMTALHDVGYPATLMPLTPNKRPQAVADEDIAEALLEHRHTLSSPASRTMIVQQGSPSPASLLEVVVIDGQATACSATAKPMLRQPETLRLAEAAAVALRAQVIGIRIAQIGTEVVVWDVDPVPEFRGLNQIGAASVAGTVAALALKLSPAGATTGNRHASGLEQSMALEEIARGIVLSA